MYRPKYVQKKESDQKDQAPKHSQYRERRENHQEDTRDSRPYKSDRRDNTDRETRKPKYVERKERDNNEEEHDNDNYDNKRTYNRYPRRNPYDSRDESKIQHYTELPRIPENRRKKPNEQDHLEKIKKIDEKKNHLKDLRRQEKDSLKNIQSGAFKRLQVVTQHIKIGEQAEKTLAKDLKEVEQRLTELNEKITGFQQNVEKFQKKTSKIKDIDTMTVRELENHIRKLEHRIITQNLDKKQTSEIRGQIDKCKRFKINNKIVDEEEVTKEEMLKEKQQKLAAMKQTKKKLKDQKHELEVKIRKTEKDLEDLYDQKENLEEQKEDFKSGPEYEKTKQYKEEIIKLREEKDKQQEKYYKAIQDYEDQQKMIAYVEWASEIKKQKLEQRQKDKAYRQKQKAREGKKDEREAKDGEPKYERPPPPHPYAKQIEYCSFLINYVQKLKPVETEKVVHEHVQKPKVNVEEQIKKGVWAKQKGIQVMIPKKHTNLDEAPEKKQPRIRDKTTKQVESHEITHNLEIERIFEQLKLAPPKSKDVKDLQETMSKLQEKKDYYQNNFSAAEGHRQRDREQKPSNNQDKKSKYAYKKTQTTEKEKPNLQLSDFPTLA